MPPLPPVPTSMSICISNKHHSVNCLLTSGMRDTLNIHLAYYHNSKFVFQSGFEPHQTDQRITELLYCTIEDISPLTKRLFDVLLMASSENFFLTSFIHIINQATADMENISNHMWDTTIVVTASAML